MRNLVKIDNTKLKYTYEESHNSIKYVSTEILDQFDNQQFVNRNDIILNFIIMHMFIENHRDSNIFHIDNFKEEMKVLTPYIKAMTEFISNVSLKKITEKDKDTFKEIRFFIEKYVESFECSKVYFKEHLLTMPTRIKEIQTVYDALIKESLY